ncbi:LacI family DNA-binding transcriptional regulator [Fodinibius salsisoli]|uniref:LacI family DNA-binding transcriptional regulator n=1 Tax=Fodinibius salsisoli TaxID=2820877 RepID=A0ABT3PPW0_9BACT|nr:LacI family DNA-binding transcriptional regulator [Fodinibius salsisoli]MCW9707897.1 LacI family DNA-binding transcriptional regulator [Fodinibius salsisoli]
MGKKNNYTVEDVAKLAEVSTATVSRVFNKSAKVNEQTSQRVLEAAKELNYRPSRVAQRLRGKRKHSMIIGLIVTDLENPFFSEIARGVEDIAYQNKNAVMVCNSNEDKAKEKFYLEALIAEQVSGFILVPTTHNNKLITEIINDEYPVVCVDRKLNIGDINVDSVTVNNKQGAYRAVERLIKLGHQRIAIINGLEELSTTVERFEGYKQALEDYDISLVDELILYADSREEGGIKSTKQLLELKERPTAIFSINNLMTLGCLEELNTQGINIPGEIALIGFDDMPWSKALNPPLTAVRQPGYELGVSAAELLLKRLSNPSRNTSDIVLNPELIVRASCGN